MSGKSFGFIGGGRAVRILLQAMKNKNQMPADIVVSDIDNDVLKNLQVQFPSIKITTDNLEPAGCDYVFISLHPPVINQTLGSIKEIVSAEAVVISLAPKITIEKYNLLLGGKRKVVRMIPNAPSYINKGYNPVSFPKEMQAEEKKELLKFFGIFGEYIETDEYNLEAYAIITAMGPTYFWFQMHQLYELGLSFGMPEHELEKGIPAMMKGAVDLMFNSGLNCNELTDLIPVKPLAGEEETINDIYRNNLQALFNKLKN